MKIKCVVRSVVSCVVAATMVFAGPAGPAAQPQPVGKPADMTKPVKVFILRQTNPVACDLEKNFVNPPDSAKPWVYWVWFAGGGRWSKEGATADLEAMKRVGINGVLIMGNPATLSTEWREKFKYAVAEAARLGMEVTAYNGPGWAGSGGSWIGPEEATKKVVWTETTIEGAQRFEGVLKQPEGFAWDPLKKDPKKHPVYYHDVAVLAFPTPEVAGVARQRGHSGRAQRVCLRFGGICAK